MKMVMFLSILIGVLLSVLFFTGLRALNPGHITNMHAKIIERNSDGLVKSVCHQGVEYIVFNGNGSAIITAVDPSGKPLPCNY